MSDRTYRLLYGLTLLLALYFQLDKLVYGLIILALSEAVSNVRLPALVTRVRRTVSADVAMPENLTVAASRRKFDFEAERALRLLLAGLLVLSFVVWRDSLWFIPWFIGFVLFGAGVSGVCPSLSLLKWLGFR